MTLVCILHGEANTRPLKPVTLDESRNKGVVCLLELRKSWARIIQICVTLDNQSEEINTSFQGSKAWPQKA